MFAQEQVCPESPKIRLDPQTVKEINRWRKNSGGSVPI
jgi:hypothetical protein